MTDRLIQLRALVSVYDKVDLREKKEELQKSISSTALVSAAGALIPIASMFVDLKILHDQAQHYRKTLCLDKDILKKCASLFKKDPDEFLIDFGLKSMMIAFTAEGLKRFTVKTATAGLAKLGSFIPIIGQAVAATASYYGTSLFLEQILEETYRDALTLREILLKELEIEEEREETRKKKRRRRKRCLLM